MQTLSQSSEGKSQASLVQVLFCLLMTRLRFTQVTHIAQHQVISNLLIYDYNPRVIFLKKAFFKSHTCFVSLWLTEDPVGSGKAHWEWRSTQLLVTSCHLLRKALQGEGQTLQKQLSLVAINLLPHWKEVTSVEYTKASTMLKVVINRPQRTGSGTLNTQLESKEILMHAAVQMSTGDLTILCETSQSQRDKYCWIPLPKGLTVVNFIQRVEW